MTKPIEAYCNEGCQKSFSIHEFETKKLEEDIERTFFACPHCKHEYTAYYTDAGVRKLQEKMRSIHRQLVQPGANIKKLEHQEKMTRKRIKNVMDYLKNKYEVKSVSN